MCLSEKIRQAAISCGFENCGIIPIDAMDGFARRLQERKENVPSSKPFYAVLGELGQTKKRFPWAKSIIVCTYYYGQFRFPKQLQGCYAKDYFLKPEEGSHYRLIGYVIDRECELIHRNDLKPCSDTCTLCQQACKTKALSGPYTMNPLNCVSFWTSFGKGVVPPHLKAEMFESWICGCDNCQDACPYNKRKNWDEGEAFSDLEELAEALAPERILSQSDAYLAAHIIAKTDNHLKASDAAVIRRNAKRALKYREN